MPIFADGRKRLRFDATLLLSDEDAKTADPVKVDGVIVDYQNVTIKGYLSTFQHVTASDRQGDYVLRGAFNETIPNFLRNPVMLANHDNDVSASGQIMRWFRSSDRSKSAATARLLRRSSPTQ